MRLIKVLSKKVGNKLYSKYIINVPKSIAEGSNLLDKELDMTILNDSIIIKNKV